jgi:hypothetical protein
LTSEEVVQVPTQTTTYIIDEFTATIFLACDEFAKDDAELFKLFINHGFIPINVSGDGNCGYYSTLISLSHLRLWDKTSIIWSGKSKMYLLQKQVQNFMKEIKSLFWNNGMLY